MIAPYIKSAFSALEVAIDQVELYIRRHMNRSIVKIRRADTSLRVSDVRLFSTIIRSFNLTPAKLVRHDLTVEVVKHSRHILFCPNIQDLLLERKLGLRS